MGQTCIGDRKTLILAWKTAIIDRKSSIWLQMMNIWQSSLWKHTQPKVMLLLFNLSPLSRSHPWLFYHFCLRVVTGHEEYWIASTPYGFSISWKLSRLINHASTIIRRFYNQWWHGKRKIWEFKNESYLNKRTAVKRVNKWNYERRHHLGMKIVVKGVKKGHLSHGCKRHSVPTEYSWDTTISLSPRLMITR